jgi:beta-phosphoglucomutase-like phosphatase (HAD superfamily)
VATTTGDNREMMDVVLREMRPQGFEPDAAVCVDDVPAGRPEPWMALEAAKRLRAYPPAACVKVGDTVPDVLEGLNAGMWTVALTRTGNELGLTQAESDALPPGELQARLERAATRLRSAGAHFVVESIANVPLVLDEITARLNDRGKPAPGGIPCAPSRAGKRSAGQRIAHLRPLAHAREAVCRISACPFLPDYASQWNRLISVWQWHRAGPG